eukprot:g6272.t1
MKQGFTNSASRGKIDQVRAPPQSTRGQLRHGNGIWGETVEISIRESTFGSSSCSNSSSKSLEPDTPTTRTPPSQKYPRAEEIDSGSDSSDDSDDGTHSNAPKLKRTVSPLQKLNSPSSSRKLKELTDSLEGTKLSASIRGPAGSGAGEQKNRYDKPKKRLRPNVGNAFSGLRNCSPRFSGSPRSSPKPRFASDTSDDDRRISTSSTPTHFVTVNLNESTKSRGGNLGLSLDMDVVNEAPGEGEGQIETVEWIRMRDGCSFILKYLYCGNSVAASNPDELARVGITHIVNCSTQHVADYYPEKYKYLSLQLRDNNKQDLTAVLYLVLQFIEDARESNGKVLVHCLRGISRSPALCAAYLMWLHDWGCSDALTYVRKCRPITDPNADFVLQLMEWRRDRPGINPRVVIATPSATPCSSPVSAKKKENTEKISTSSEVDVKNRKSTTSKVEDKRNIGVAIKQHAAVLKTPAGDVPGGGLGLGASSSNSAAAVAFRVVRSSSLWHELAAVPAACRLPSSSEGAAAAAAAREYNTEKDYALTIGTSLPMTHEDLSRIEKSDSELGLVVCTKDRKSVYVFCPEKNVKDDTKRLSPTSVLDACKSVATQMSQLESCGTEDGAVFLSAKNIGELQEQAKQRTNGVSAMFLDIVLRK